MKTPFKFINFLVLALLLTTSSCNNDDAPVVVNLQDLEVTIDENPTTGQVIGTVQSDSNSSLTYSITTQSPTGALSINSSTGALTVADASLFDFETNPIITATVTADKAVNTATITINLVNLEAIIQDLTLSIAENPTIGQIVGTLQTSAGGALNFNITSQTPVGALSLDSNTGELTVANATLFDFETNPVITASVSADESVNMANITINLTNVNEITIQDLNENINENPTDGQSIGTVQTTGGVALNFSITSQTPAGALSINSNSGELIVVDAILFDFETNPTITATITAGDAINTATITIDLNDLHEVGEFKFGGVIFWMNASSNQGLVVSISDQSNSAMWGCSGVDVLEAYGSQIGTGNTNTTAIESICTTSGTAADIAANLSLNGYDDWFLPSWGEFGAIYTNKTIINATALANGGSFITEEKYWTSTSVLNSMAYSFRFWDGIVETEFKNSAIKVRAVRAFSDL